MASPTLPKTAPAVADVPAAPARRPPVPVGPALASAALLWAAFPPNEWGPLAWVALVPLFTLVRSERPAWKVYLAGWAGGLAFWLLAISWVATIDDTAWLAWLVMALVLSLEWPIGLLVARLGARRLGLPLMVAAPVAWVAIEYVRAHILSGFPWYYLAHTQYRFAPLIQVADLAGSLGLSLLIAAANACWVDLLTRPLFRPTPAGPRLARPRAIGLGALALALAGTLGYGAARLASADFKEGPTLALLQSNYIQRYEMRLTAGEIRDGMVALVRKAMATTAPPDLIVWPETAFPFGFVRIDPKLSDAEFQAQVAAAAERRPGVSDWKLRRADITGYLGGMVNGLRVPMLIGASTDDFGPKGFTRSNSAVLVRPDEAEFPGYSKMQLVPFGEYIPLIDLLPWLTVLTPYRGAGIPKLEPGAGPAWFDLGPYRLATIICFEDTVPQVARRFFAEAPDGRHPDVLVNITNDGWFHGTSEQEMHLAVSVFRAVENRVPLARAVNTGISALIDGNGRIVATLPKLKDGVLTVKVPLDGRTGLYSTWGDWLGRSCLAIALGTIPLAWIRRRPAAIAA